MLYNNNCQEGMKGGFLMEDKTKENEEMTENYSKIRIFFIDVKKSVCYYIYTIRKETKGNDKI